MDIKYTFRDLLVYLLTGIAVVGIIVISWPGFFKDFVLWMNPKAKIDYNSLINYFKTKDTLNIIIAIPILYLIGHTIQIFDLILSFRIARWLKKKTSKFAKRLYVYVGKPTVEYQRTEGTDGNDRKLSIDETQWTDMEFFVKIHGKYSLAEYLYLLKELFNGLKTFQILFIFILICHELVSEKYFFDFSWGVVLFNILLCYLFYIKAVNSAKNYVWNVRNTFVQLKENITTFR